MRREDERAFREYVVGRIDRLRRTAYLLCRDWHTADDLVAITLMKLYRHWRRAEAAQNLDAYVRGMLARVWLDELRRPWRREVSVAEVPDQSTASHDRVSERAALVALLESLPPRQRAIVILRYYCDLSVAEIAEALGIAPGTVKSQASRGLELLRAVAPADTTEEVS